MHVQNKEKKKKQKKNVAPFHFFFCSFFSLSLPAIYTSERIRPPWPVSMLTLCRQEVMYTWALVAVLVKEFDHLFPLVNLSQPQKQTLRREWGWKPARKTDVCVYVGFWKWIWFSRTFCWRGATYWQINCPRGERQSSCFGICGVGSWPSATVEATRSC